MYIPIVYEDEHIVAVAKPSGLSVHSAAGNGARGDGRTRGETLADWVSMHYPALENVGEPAAIRDTEHRMPDTAKRPGIVHRLDKETSGVMLLAKTQEAFLFLKKQFQEREIRKTYKAVVYGNVKKTRGIIDAPLARSAGDFRKRTTLSAACGERSRTARGRERAAVTEYRVLAKNERYSFLDVYPKTGRTHQIRVHLKSIGNPVVCDRLYAPKRPCPAFVRQSLTTAGKPVRLDRLALHAFSLEFKTPRRGRLHLEAPLPDDMLRFIGAQFPSLQIE